MAKPRSYNLLCPIARALDAVGDRWSLLILRDLHAGPARFADLQNGLTGIASNLLSDRLSHLNAEGFIEKTTVARGPTYQLTPLGQSTRGLLFDLARLGGGLPPTIAPKRPGNLRTIAVTLAAALERAELGDLRLNAQMDVDGEPFSILLDDSKVSVLAEANPNSNTTLRTGYEALLAVSSGQKSPDDFVREDAEFVGGTPQEQRALVQALGRAIALMQ